MPSFRFEIQAAKIEARKQAHYERLMAPVWERERKRRERQERQAAAMRLREECQRTRDLRRSYTDSRPGFLASMLEEARRHATGELAELIADQAADDRRYQIQSPWMRSFDAPDQYGYTLHDKVAA